MASRLDRLGPATGEAEEQRDEEQMMQLALIVMCDRVDVVTAATFARVTLLLLLPLLLPLQRLHGAGGGVGPSGAVRLIHIGVVQHFRLVFPLLLIFFFPKIFNWQNFETFQNSLHAHSKK